jgi:hypothetical protein
LISTNPKARPEWSLAWLAALIMAWWFLFWIGYRSGAIVPTVKESYLSFKTSETVPGDYPRFNAFVYSADNALPLLKLGQAEHWQPDPDPSNNLWRVATLGETSFWMSLSGVLMVFKWAEIIFGWFFATMGIAAITGIIRQD